MSTAQADIAAIDSELKAHIKHDDERYNTIHDNIKELRNKFDALQWKVGVIVGVITVGANGISHILGV